MLKSIIFILVSGYLIWLSRNSLGKIRSHGFYRFFGWEAILILVLINANTWFDDWLCLRQIISWILLTIATYLVTHGVITLYKSGKPGDSRTDQTLVGVEKTTALVTSGIYGYIRHPIYASAVIGIWGVTLKDISVISIVLALITVLFFTVTAKMEEQENLEYFGGEYRAYMDRTKMFIPFLF